MSHRVLSSTSLRRSAIALASVAAVSVAPAGASAAVRGYALDQFKLTGTTRATVVVTPPAQVDGYPVSLGGYYRVCSATGPDVRFRARFQQPGTAGQTSYRLDFSWLKGFTPVKFANGSSFIDQAPPATYPGAATSKNTISEALGANLIDHSKAPRLPRPGSYTLLVTPNVPFATGITIGGLAEFSIALPQMPLITKLTIRTGTATECAAPTGALHAG